MLTALNTIPALTGNVTVTGGGGRRPTPHAWNVTFTGTLANKALASFAGAERRLGDRHRCLAETQRSRS